MVALQAPLSMGFFRQEYWRGLSFPPPGDLPNPEMEPVSSVAPAWAGFFTTLQTLCLSPTAGRGGPQRKRLRLPVSPLSSVPLFSIISRLTQGQTCLRKEETGFLGPCVSERHECTCSQQSSGLTGECGLTHSHTSPAHLQLTLSPTDLAHVLWNPV